MGYIRRGGGRVLGGTYLADLEPDRGLARLAPLPDELAGEAGYEKSVVISCPSNETGDKISEVTYELRNMYQTLEGTLRPYHEPADNFRVRLEIFSDPIDRDPGAPAGGADPDLVQLSVGQELPVLASIEKAYHLRLRAVCEEPGALLILAMALVR